MILQESSGALRFLGILRVFRVETRLTVYRPLDILKELCRSKGLSGQRLSVLWTSPKKRSASQTHSGLPERFDQVFLHMSGASRTNIRPTRQGFDDICQDSKFCRRVKNCYFFRKYATSYFSSFYESFGWKPG